jgi:predicted Rdx family selenoprotein
VAAEIEREFDLTPQLVGGGGGIFEVRVDGDLIFTNNRVGGVPPAEDVLAVLAGVLRPEER